MKNFLVNLFTKALDLVKDDAKLVVTICVLSVVTVLLLIEKGVINV